MHKDLNLFLMLWVGESRGIKVPSRVFSEADYQSGAGLVQPDVAFCGAGSVRKHTVGDIH